MVESSIFAGIREDTKPNDDTVCSNDDVEYFAVRNVPFSLSNINESE